MKKWLVRILWGVVVLSVVSAVGTYFFIQNSVDTLYGGKVALAQPALSTDSPQHYVVVNAAVLSADGQRFLKDHSVWVEDGEIRAVGAALEYPDSLPVIDATGLYLVPGYTDSHVHLWNSANDLWLYLANGVTQVREMHGQPHHLDWRQQIQSGERLGPDLFVTAAQLATYGFLEGHWIEMTAKRNVVRTPEQTVTMIQSLAEQGYDAIKASSYLSRENYIATAQGMKTVDIPLVGHLPVESELDDFWASKQTELAHVEELVKALDREYGGFRSGDSTHFLDYVQAQRAVIAQKVVTRGITVTSTLAVVNSFAQQAVDLDSALVDSEMQYVNAGVAEGQAFGWHAHVNPYRAPDRARSEGWQQRYRTYWSTYAQAQNLLFESLLDAGANILAGTDANVPVMVPGLSLHQEMQAMQDTGMTATEALASATSVPGQWMGWNTGKVRQGYRANLVLLRENPLTDIAATDSIESVIMHGRLLTRSDLDAMLKAVENANADSRTIDISPYQNGTSKSG